MIEDDERRWYYFDYNGGSRVTLHYSRPSFIERVRQYVKKHNLDVVITESYGNRYVRSKANNV